MQLNGFTDKDLEQWRALGAVIAQGNFELEGKAIVRVASLVQWYGSIEDKLKLAIAEAKANAAKKQSEDKPKEE